MLIALFLFLALVLAYWMIQLVIAGDGTGVVMTVLLIAAIGSGILFLLVGIVAMSAVNRHSDFPVGGTLALSAIICVGSIIALVALDKKEKEARNKRW